MSSSANDYPDGWPEFARQVKDEAGWKCERCGHPDDLESGHVLTVHHLTMNKSQPFTDRWAFAALCQRCHLKIQARVDFEQGFMFEHSEWFRPHLEGYMAAMAAKE